MIHILNALHLIMQDTNLEQQKRRETHKRTFPSPYLDYVICYGAKQYLFSELDLLTSASR